jgi:hypothetical protein
MLPDLDSDSGRPVREVFGVTGAAASLLLLRRWENTGLTAEGAILLAAACYLGIRFGGAWLLGHLTVHRGMFHSLPAALITAEAVFLAHDSPDFRGRAVLAGGALLGFLSHLFLDEISREDARGFRLKLGKATGHPLKLASSSVAATGTAWLVLATLTYLIGIEVGYFRPLSLPINSPGAQQAPIHREGLPTNIPGPGAT